MVKWKKCVFHLSKGKPIDKTEMGHLEAENVRCETYI